MKIKIIKQFGAAIAAVCILYGAVATTYNSYEKVLAAQVDTPAIVTKETTSEASAETTPSTGATTTAATTTTTSTPVTASTQTATSTATAEPAADISEPATTPKETLASVADTTDQTVAASTPSVPTLNEFLSQLRCGGCGKNCSLASPRCATGSRKAQQAEAQYDATYS